MSENGNALTVQDNYELMEKVLLDGDLSQLAPEERLEYYSGVCRSLGLNPATRPFDYIRLNGKLTLYAKKDATEQLRKINSVSITGLDKDWKDNLHLYVVTAHALDKTGRTDAATGAVSVKGLSGDALANAIMKAETKAKRRVTLSICGLGFLDEAEVASIPDAMLVSVTEKGDIAEEKKAEETKTDGNGSSQTKKTEEKSDASLITIWDGKTQKQAQALIGQVWADKIEKEYVGKDKVFDHASHLKNHVRKHFQVDFVKELTWERAVALVAYCRAQQGDERGRLDPRWYGETIEKAVGKPDDADLALAQAGPITPESAKTDATAIAIRWDEELGLSHPTGVPVSLGAVVRKTHGGKLDNWTQEQMQKLWSVMDAVKSGAIEPTESAIVEAMNL